MKLHWTHHENTRPDIQADIVTALDYVISCRPKQFTLSSCPYETDLPLGNYPTLEAAQDFAEKHYNQ